MKDIYIEWIVTLAVVLITTFNMLQKCVELFYPPFKPIVFFIRLSVLLLMLYYQNQHYGIKVKAKPFFLFFLLYSLYILFYLTEFSIYPIDILKHVPKNVFSFIVYTTMIVLYMLCAKTIIHKFNFRKFLYLSIIVAIVPTIWYINLVGIDFIQYMNVTDGEDSLFIHQLLLAYANVPIWVLCILFYKKIHKNKFVNYALFFLLFLSVSYILIISTKRGPIIWGLVNLLTCSILIGRYKIKKILTLVVIGVIAFININTIFNVISEYAPNTAERFKSTIVEGNTSGRFESSEGEGGYSLAINQFNSSPIWGSYFRLVTPSGFWKGHYPHNIFLEMLITMGLVGFIPFVLLLIKAVKNIKTTLTGQHNDHILALVSLFFASFLESISTGTLVLNSSFWVLFYLMGISDQNTVFNRRKRFNRLFGSIIITSFVHKHE